MPHDSVIERDEVAALLLAVFDILAEIRAIREFLEGDDEEEAGFQE